MKHLYEDSILTSRQKMQAVQNGTRRQNWKACSDDKLCTYYWICLRDNLLVAKGQCQQEIIRRKYFDWLEPIPQRMTWPIYADVQQVWQNRFTPAYFVKRADDIVATYGDTFRKSQYYLRAMLIAVALNDDKLMSLIVALENLMKQPETYYDWLSGYVKKLAADQKYVKGLTDAINQAKLK